jgi:hypothetical protein
LSSVGPETTVYVVTRRDVSSIRVYLEWFEEGKIKGWRWTKTLAYATGFVLRRGAELLAARYREGVEVAPVKRKEVGEIR